MAKASRPSRIRDNVYFGAFLGLVFPVLGFLLFYVFAFSEAMSLQQYWNHLFDKSIMSAALSLSILMNLAVFFFFLSNRKYESVKGVIGATMFYGIFIILFKFS